MHIITAMKPGRLWLHSHQEYLDPLKSGIDGNTKDSPPSLTQEKSSEDESDTQPKISDSDRDIYDSNKSQSDRDPRDSSKSQSDRDQRDSDKSERDSPSVLPFEHHNKHPNLRNNFRCSLIIRKESLKELIDKDIVANKGDQICSEKHKGDASVERSSSVIILCGQTPVNSSNPQCLSQPIKLTNLPQTIQSSQKSLTPDDAKKDDLKSPKIPQELIKSLDSEAHDVPERQTSPASSIVQIQNELLVTEVKDTSSQEIENSFETITFKGLKVSKDSEVNKYQSSEEQALLIQNSSTPKYKTLLPQNNNLSINLKLTRQFRSPQSPPSSLEEKLLLSPQSPGHHPSSQSNKLSIRHSSLQRIIETPQNYLSCSNSHPSQTTHSPKSFLAHFEHEDRHSFKDKQDSKELKVSKDHESVHNNLMIHALTKDTEIPTVQNMISVRHHENEPLLKKRRILEPTEYHDNCPTELKSNAIKVNAGVGSEESSKISEKLESNISLKTVSNKENGEPCDSSCVSESQKTSNESLSNHSSVVIAEEQKVPSTDHDFLSSDLNFMAKTEVTALSNFTKEHRQPETLDSKNTSDSGTNEMDGLVENGTPEENHKNSEFNEEERSGIRGTEQGESQDILARACLAVGLDEEEFMAISDPYDETSQHHTSTPQISNDNNRFLYPNTQWDQSEIQSSQNSHFIIRADKCSRTEENISFETNNIKGTETSKETNMNFIQYSVPYRFPYRMPYSVPANSYPHPVGARLRQASFHPNYSYTDPIYYNYPRNIAPSQPAYYTPPHLVNMQKYQSGDPSKTYTHYYRYPYQNQSGKMNPASCYSYDTSGTAVKNFNGEPNGKLRNIPQQYSGFAALENSTLHNKGPVGFSQPKRSPLVRPSMLPVNNAPKPRTNCYSPARSPITPAIFPPRSPSSQHPCTMSYENGRQAMNPNSHIFNQSSRTTYPHATIHETPKEYCNPPVNYAHQLPHRSLPTIPTSQHFSNETISNSNKNFINNSMNVQNPYYNYPSIENSYSQEVCQAQYRQTLQNTSSIPYSAPLSGESEYYLNRMAPPNHFSYIPQHPKQKIVPKLTSSYYPIHHKYRSNQICNRKELNKNNLNKESLSYVANYAGPFTIEQLQKEKYPFPYSYTDWKVPTATQIEGHKIEKMRNPNYIAYQEEKMVKPTESLTTVPQHNMQARDANVSSVNISNHKSEIQRPLNFSDHHSSEYGVPRVPQATTAHVNGYQSSISSKPDSEIFEQKSDHETLNSSVIHNHHIPLPIPPACNGNHFNSRTTAASSVIMETPNYLHSNNNSVISHTITQNPILSSVKQFIGSSGTSAYRIHPTTLHVPTTSVSSHFSPPITSLSTPESRQLPSCRYQKFSTGSVDTLSTQDRSFPNISESRSANELTSPYMNSSVLLSHNSELYDSIDYSQKNNCQQSNSNYHSGLSSASFISIREKQSLPNHTEHSNSNSHYSCPQRIVYSSNHPRPSSEPTWGPCEKGHVVCNQDRIRPRPLSLPNQISIGPFILNKGFATYSISEKDEDEEEIFIFEQKFLPVIGHLLSIPEAANLRPYRDNPDELLIHLVQLWGGEGAQSKLEEKYQRMKDNFMSVVKYLFEPHLLSLWGWDKAAPEQILDELIKPSDQGSLPRVVFAGRFSRHVSSTASLESAGDFLEDDVFLPGESMPDVFDCLDEIDHSSKYDPLFHCKDDKYLSSRKASDVVTSDMKWFTSSDDKIVRTTVCRGSEFDTEYCSHNATQGTNHEHVSKVDSTHNYSETLSINSETSVSSARSKEACYSVSNHAKLGNETCRSDFKNNVIPPKQIAMKRSSSNEDDANPFIKRPKLPSFKDVDVFPVELKSEQLTIPLNNDDLDKKSSKIKFQKATLTKVSKVPEVFNSSNYNESCSCSFYCKTAHSVTNEKSFSSMCLIDENDKIPDVSIFKLENHVNKPYILPDKESRMICQTRELDSFPESIAKLNEDEPGIRDEGNDNSTFEYSHYLGSSNQLSSFEPKTLETNNSEIKHCTINKNESTLNPPIFSFEALDDHISKLVENKSKFNSLKVENSEPKACEVVSLPSSDKTDVISHVDFNCSTEAGKPVTSDEVERSSLNISPKNSTSAAAFDWEELTKHLLQYKETLANKNSSAKVETQQYVDEFRSNESLHALEALISDECVTVVKNDSICEQHDLSDSSNKDSDESNDPRNEVPDLSMNKGDLKSKNTGSDIKHQVHDCRDIFQLSTADLDTKTFNNQNSVKISSQLESRQTSCNNDNTSTALNVHENTLKNFDKKENSTCLDDRKDEQVKSIELSNSIVTDQSVPDEFVNKNSADTVNDQPFSISLTAKANEGKLNSCSSISSIQQHSIQTGTDVGKTTAGKVTGSDFLSKIRTTKKNNTSSPNKSFAGTTRDYNAIFQKYIEKKLLSDQYGRETSDVIPNDSFNNK